MMKYARHVSRRIKKDEEGKIIRNELVPSPDFPPSGDYFFNIHEDLQTEVQPGKIYLFTYGNAHERNQKSRRNKPIFVRKANPIIELPFEVELNAEGEQTKDAIKEAEKQANAFIRAMMKIVRKELMD